MIIRSLKPHNWLRYKSFKSHTFNACKWPRWAENKTYLQNSWNKKTLTLLIILCFFIYKFLWIKKTSTKTKKIQVATQTYKKFKRVSIFCLIQGINNCIQMITHWNYIVCIGINTYWNKLSTNWLASNIILLASKKCFHTSQGLVGAGMNCRAL